MTSKERISAIWNRKPHDRLGWDFLDPAHQDIFYVPEPVFTRPGAEETAQWGRYPGLLEKVPGFRGEVRMDEYGNIYGRLQGKTKGECVYGALQDGWEQLDRYTFPTFDCGEYVQTIRQSSAGAEGKYLMAAIPGLFSNLRDVRLLANALMDTIEEPEAIEDYLDRLFVFTCSVLDAHQQAGTDGVILFDDWGTQNAPLINPRSFDKLFRPAYARLADACHARGLDLIVHSCGMVYPLVPAFVDAGVNAMQFDQPELTGSDVWAREFGDRIAFYCPVDIQKVLSTGDRAYIEQTAAAMCDAFRANGGNLVAKDYPTPWDIDISMDCVRWAMDTIAAHSEL